MAAFLRDRVTRTLQSVLALGCGWIAAFSYLVLSGQALLPEDFDWTQRLYRMLLVVLGILAPSATAFWLLVFLPTSLVLDIKRGRWTVLGWSVIGVIEAQAFGLWWFGLPVPEASLGEILASPGTRLFVAVGLPIGASYGLLRMNDCQDTKQFEAV